MTDQMVPPPLTSLPIWRRKAEQPPSQPAPRRQLEPEADPAAPDAALAVTGSGEPHAWDSGIDWALVATLRQAAAKELSSLLDAGGDPATERAIGADVVTRLLRLQADTDTAAGLVALDRHSRSRLHSAVMDSLFGLGRLQPLADLPGIENVELYGCRRTVLCFADGRLVTGPPVAESDDELLEMLAWIAARQGGGHRPFSPAHPRLHLRLDNGARLAAIGWVSAEPVVVIRLHRLVRVTLADLVARQMMTAEVADFLGRAVRAGMSVVVAGPQGGGKTTMLRALAREIPERASVVTVETEYELALREAMPERRIKELEARPGSGERGLNGRMAGEISIADLVEEDVWRLNAGRVIVGEVRGPEVLDMIKVMAGGSGSMSTVHADTARDAVERLITLAMAAGPQVSAEYARRQVGQHIDLIVQLRMHEEPTESPGEYQQHRYVSEVVALAHEGDGLGFSDLFTAGADRVAVRNLIPAQLASRLGLR